MNNYDNSHWRLLHEEIRRMIEEVPLYQNYPTVPHFDDNFASWFGCLPIVNKQHIRKGFPKTLVRHCQDLRAAMRDNEVTLLATSGTTTERLQMIWQWNWWDPQERHAMRYNSRVAHVMSQNPYRELVMTTPICGGGSCHIGEQSMAERIDDGILFINQHPDPSHWHKKDYERMIEEWQSFKPTGVEADPAYLALFCRYAQQQNISLFQPEYVCLTYETTIQAYDDAIRAVLGPHIYQLYGATEVGVLFMECENGHLHANVDHGHIDLLPLDNDLARVIVTTLKRPWMPLLRYEVGDVVQLSKQLFCDCGLAMNGPLLKSVEGRLSDCIKVGRKTITPMQIDRVIAKTSPQIKQWQLEGKTLLCVGAGSSQAAAAVSEILHDNIVAREVQAIAPESSGKYRLVRQ